MNPDDLQPGDRVAKYFGDGGLVHDAVFTPKDIDGGGRYWFYTTQCGRFIYKTAFPLLPGMASSVTCIACMVAVSP